MATNDNELKQNMVAGWKAVNITGVFPMFR